MCGRRKDKSKNISQELYIKESNFPSPYICNHIWIIRKSKMSLHSKGIFIRNYNASNEYIFPGMFFFLLFDIREMKNVTRVLWGRKGIFGQGLKNERRFSFADSNSVQLYFICELNNKVIYIH